MFGHEQFVAYRYSIARGEAMECAAIMDILLCMRMVDSSTAKQAKDLLENVVAILSSVCKRKFMTND